MTLLKNVDFDDVYTVWFDKTNAEEFEPIRDIILSDTISDVFDYTKERLIVENHNTYGVLFYGDEVVMTGGLYSFGEWARVMNRHYISPKYRGKILRDFKISTVFWVEKLLKPMIQQSTFKTHVMSHVIKKEKSGYGKWIVDEVNKYFPTNTWHIIDGYIKTSGKDSDPRSWQWAITDNPSYPFRKINHDQWLLINENFKNNQ